MTALIQDDSLFVVTYASVINCRIFHIYDNEYHLFSISRNYRWQSLPFIIKISYTLKTVQLLFAFSTSYLLDIFTWKTIFTDSWVFRKLQALPLTLNEFVR